MKVNYNRKFDISQKSCLFFAWLLSDTSEQWHQWIAQVLWWDSIRLPINLEIENNNISTVVENSESLLYTFMNRICSWNIALKTSSVNPGMKHDPDDPDISRDWIHLPVEKKKNKTPEIPPKRAVLKQRKIIHFRVWKSNLWL